MFLDDETSKILVLVPIIEPSQGPCGSKSEEALRNLRSCLRIGVRQTVYVLWSWRGDRPDLASALQAPIFAFADFHSDDRDSDRNGDNTANDSERNSRRDVYPGVGHHLGANKHENNSEAFVEILKIGQDSGQQKIKRAQAQNRTDI